MYDIRCKILDLTNIGLTSYIVHLKLYIYLFIAAFQYLPCLEGV